MGKGFSKWKVTGWGAGILVSLLLAGFWQARSGYEARLRHQIWPTHVPEFSPCASSANPSLLTVLLLGDSRIAYWGLPPFRHWHVVNAGAGGLTTSQILLLAPKALDEAHPDVVVLQAGINDLKYLGLKPQMASTIVSLAVSNLTATVRECLKRRCQVILLETWPATQPDWKRRLVWSKTISASVTQLNSELQKLNTPDHRVTVVNLFDASGLKPEAELYCDTLHFKPETYQRLTPVLETLLDQLRTPAARLLPGI